MKTKLDYKSKKKIIITLITIVLMIAAVAGVTVFIKGNKNASAIENENIASSTNKDNEKTDENNTNENINILEENNNNTNDKNKNSTNSKEKNNNVNNNIDVPNQEYTQTKKITKEIPAWDTKNIGWSPIQIEQNNILDNLQFSKPILSSKKEVITQDGNNAVQVNDKIEYVIKVKNEGITDLTNVRITDVVPVGTELVDNSLTNDGHLNNNTITWKTDIKKDETIKLSFKVKVVSDEINVIENTANVNGKETNKVETPVINTNKEAEIIEKDGTLTKRDARTGENIRYTITIKNRSNIEATTKVKDKIPENTTLIENSINEYGIVNDNEIIWNEVKVPPMSEIKLNFDVKINENAPKTISNIAVVGNTNTNEEIVNVRYHYMVEHLKQNLDGTYDVADTDVIEDVKAGDKATYTEKEYVGFELDEIKTNEENKNLVVPENNDLVIKVYYKRKIFDYKVEYYLQNLENNEYTLKDTEEKNGIYNDLALFEVKTYEGFTYNENKTENKNVLVPANNDLVIKLYYDRNNYNYKVHYFYDGIENVDKAVIKSVKYQTVIDNYEDKNITGYMFEKDENKPLTVTENEENNYINVYYIKNSFNYTVHYFYDGIEDVNKKETAKATYKEVIYNYKDKKIKGYKFNKTENLPLIVSEDEANNYINIYYEKDTFTYKVEYYTQNLDDNNYSRLDNETVTNSGLYGDAVIFTKKDFTGFTYDESKSENINVTTIPANNDLVIKLYYNRNLYSYRVEYYLKDVGNDTYTRDDEATDIIKDVKYQEKVSYEVKQFNGFDYIPSKTENGNALVPANNDLVIKLYYNRKLFTYTVQYYKQNLNQDRYDLAETIINNNVEYGSKATYEQKQYEGFTLNTDKTENGDALVPLNNMLVIKLYYDRASYNYTVNYYYNNVKGNNSVSTKVPYGTEITSFEDKSFYNNLQYIKYKETPLPITIISENQEINVYYGIRKLSINKTSVDSINPGDTITYTITVTNKGFIKSEPITITDTIPPELENISNISGGGILNSNNTEINWNNIVVPINSKLTFTYKAKVKASTIGKTIVNNVTMSGIKFRNDEIQSASKSVSVSNRQVNIMEMTKSKKAENLNITFIMDNSGSMNWEIEGKSYRYKPNISDVILKSKDEKITRLYNAKLATKEFVESIYKSGDRKNTNVSLITFNTPSNKTTTPTVEVVDENVQYTERNGRYVDKNGNIEEDEVIAEDYRAYPDGYIDHILYNKFERGTDGNYYKCRIINIISGPTLRKTCNASNYQSFLKAVDDIYIGDRISKSGVGTIMYPALDKANDVVNEYKNNATSKENKNIVIILCDGDLDDVRYGRNNDTYRKCMENLKKLKGNVDAIFSIGFGPDVLSNSEMRNTMMELSTDGKVHTAQDSETLLKQFNIILDEASKKLECTTSYSSTSKVTDIKKGEIAFDITAPLTMDMPIKAYNDGVEQFTCTSMDQFDKYGIVYDEKNNVIRWNINTCLENNPTLKFSGSIKFEYYIKED